MYFCPKCGTSATPGIPCRNCGYSSKVIREISFEIDVDDDIEVDDRVIFMNMWLKNDKLTEAERVQLSAALELAREQQINTDLEHLLKDVVIDL